MTSRTEAACPPVAQATFPSDPTSVRKARAFVAGHCAPLCQDARDVAVLLTSELVTNALIHGRSEARVAVYLGRGRVRVEVGDDNSRGPQVQETDDDALDGRGLQILQHAAAQWGVRHEGLGKVVWFDVDCADHA